MKKMMLIIFTLFIVIGVPCTSFSFSFLDDFNDGNLDGWTNKQGIWSNPGDHLLSSYDNYGIIWKDDSFGFDQFLQVDAFFDDGGFTKSAQLRLRSGDAGRGGNPYFDHGYYAGFSDGNFYIGNAVEPFHQEALGSISISLSRNAWHTLAFSITGFGNDTNLKLWVDDTLYLDVFDITGYQHDDGGYLALGSSNHINRYIKYDNISGMVDAAPVPEPATILLFGFGLAGLAGTRIRRKKK